MMAAGMKDPFDDESEGSEILPSEGFSVLDPCVHKDIFKQVYDLDRLERDIN